MKKLFNLSIDDFSPAVSCERCLSYIIKLLSEFPDIKVSLFTIPFYKSTPFNQVWAEWVRDLPAGNIELCPHGFLHNGWEFNNLTEEQAEEKIKQIEESFNSFNLPFSKVFKAPSWRLGENAHKILKKHGYTIASLNGHERQGDIVSGLIDPYMVYSTHVSDHDKNTNFLGKEQYEIIRRHIHEQNVDFSFLGDFPIINISKYEQWNKKLEREDVWEYKTNEWQKKRYEDVYNIIPNVASVLEIGCCEGEFTKKLTNTRVVGIDLSSFALSRAQKKSPHTFYVWDIEEKPIQEQFDLVILMEMLYYCANTVKVKENILRSLKKGGFILLEHVLSSGIDNRPIASVYHKPFLEDVRLKVVKTYTHTEERGSSSYEIVLLQYV